MRYYFQKTVDASFDEAIARATEALTAEGFGVLTTIDAKATLKKKLNVDFRRYTILGACNPRYAYQALQMEPNIGLMLPCNVVVQETDAGEVQVSAINPLASMASVDNPQLAEVGEKVRDLLKKVTESL